jgi:hypothetical protein
MVCQYRVHGRDTRRIQIVAALPALSRQLYMIDSGIIHSEINFYQKTKSWRCHVRERYSWGLSVLDLNHNDVRVLSSGLLFSMGRERSWSKTYVTQYIDRFYRPMLGLPPSVPPSDTAANLHRFVRIPKCVRNIPARADLRRMVHRQKNNRA